MVDDIWMKPEEWLPVCNFPDYEVSNKARIRKLSSKRELVTAYQGPTLKVTLRGEDGKQHQVSVKTIMAETFHGGPHPGCRIVFKDGNRQNLHADNLMWEYRINKY